MGALSYEPFRWVLALGYLAAVLVALYTSFRVGRVLVTEILADARPMPAWLEAVAPVKGRWLRLLLASPGLALFLTIAFIAVLLLAQIVLGLLALAVSFLGSVVLEALTGRR